MFAERGGDPLLGEGTVSGTDMTAENSRQLVPGAHVCWLYETDAEHERFVTRFLRQGLELGQKVICITDACSAQTILAYLEQAECEPRPYLDSGQLAILERTDTYLRGGSFDPERMIALLRESTDQALAEGYPALRVTGEMSWAFRRLPGTDHLVEYESRLEEFLPGSKTLAVCQYDRRRYEERAWKLQIRRRQRDAGVPVNDEKRVGSMRNAEQAARIPARTVGGHLGYGFDGDADDVLERALLRARGPHSNRPGSGCPDHA
jgi:hypothetical protein